MKAGKFKLVTGR